VLPLECIAKGAPIEIHGMEKCALIDLHAEMCSHWLACKHVCSHWNTWRNVLSLTCMQNVLLSTCLQKCAPDSEISECSFTSTAKHTLVELQNEICIRFHFLAKVLLLTIQRTRVLLLTSTVDIYLPQWMTTAVPFASSSTTSLLLFFDIHRTKQGKLQNFDIQLRGTAIALLATRSQQINNYRRLPRARW